MGKKRIMAKNENITVILSFLCHLGLILQTKRSESFVSRLYNTCWNSGHTEFKTFLMLGRITFQVMEEICSTTPFCDIAFTEYPADDCVLLKFLFVKPKPSADNGSHEVFLTSQIITIIRFHPFKA